jgi:hypothetical protein
MMCTGGNKLLVEIVYGSDEQDEWGHIFCFVTKVLQYFIAFLRYK